MSRRFLSLTLGATLVAAAGAAASADRVAPPVPAASISLDAYLAELDRCAAAAARLGDHPAEAPSLRRTLPPAWVVSAEGQSFSVPTDWLRSALDKYPADRGQALARSREIVQGLAALESGARGLEGARPPDAAAARQALDGILARREFSGVKPPAPLQTWWDRAMAWLDAKLGALFGRLGAHPKFTSSMLWIVVAALALLLVTWLVGAALGGRPQLALDLGGPVAPEAWREWAAKALERAGAGDFREAIHLAYWAAVYRLGERGLWQVDRSRTPREYLGLVPAGNAQRAPLQALTRRFEHTWYGGARASADDFRQAAAELEDLGCRLGWNAETARS